jgi:2-polyprenyl-3-methyl-5-hydroxy-6-metoxy-1,4-benzoquinol methylase
MTPNTAMRVHPLYSDAGALQRILAWGRPYICPFDPLLPWVPQGSLVFDIGCGAGLWLLTLAQAGRILGGVGCDTNASALATARAAAAHLASALPPDGLDFVCTERVQDWPDRQFDVVCLIDVLHHVPRALQDAFLLAALARVRPGGRLVYKDMADAPLPFAAFNALHDLVLARQVIRYLPIERAVAVLTAGGARVLHQDAWRRAFYAHELLVIER